MKKIALLLLLAATNLNTAPDEEVDLLCEEELSVSDDEEVNLRCAEKPHDFYAENRLANFVPRNVDPHAVTLAEKILSSLIQEAPPANIEAHIRTVLNYEDFGYTEMPKHVAATLRVYTFGTSQINPKELTEKILFFCCQLMKGEERKKRVAFEKAKRAARLRPRVG